MTITLLTCVLQSSSIPFVQLISLRHLRQRMLPLCRLNRKWPQIEFNVCQIDHRLGIQDSGITGDPLSYCPAI
ncbi:hypothetical protein PILCRDRAFT_425672 [Piloderma croceum F 1598]|uniref:Uncharacterized protein n=1 Tax=Piloderma croceum (strain F 1598) TaxID=765440 RepID=A0A0C3BB05_PILCF|nr:hypothetical protein PILCRDRAFT_425672 [Piloderma croceum F 1598]